MGLLIDGLIGPLLETFGVIEVGENGEWTRKTHEAPEKEYQKKEREDKESLWERCMKWLRNTSSQLKNHAKKSRTPKERFRAAVKRDPEELKETISETVKDILKESEPSFTNPIGFRTRKISKAKLREISKFEGKVLASNEGYKIWYGDHFPYDHEVEEGVVYIVKGQGDMIAYTGPLAGIRKDAYYVWDKTKETLERIGTTPPETVDTDRKETFTDSQTGKKISVDTKTGEITIKNRDNDTRWHFGGLMAYNPNRNYVIYPNTVDDYDGDLFDKIGNL